RTDRGAGVCVGRPVAGMRVEVMRIGEEAVGEWSDDLAVPDGGIGELVVHGPVVTQSYDHRPEATRLSKVSAGEGASPPLMHRTGDLGYRDERGRLWFC